MPWTEWLTLLLFGIPGAGMLAVIEAAGAERIYPVWFGPAVVALTVIAGLGFHLWLRRRLTFDRFWRPIAIMTVPIAALGPLVAQTMSMISLQGRIGQAVAVGSLLWLFLAFAVGGVTARRVQPRRDR